jgi:hypothetical protein
MRKVEIIKALDELLRLGWKVEEPVKGKHQSRRPALLDAP